MYVVWVHNNYLSETPGFWLVMVPITFWSKMTIIILCIPSDIAYLIKEYKMMFLNPLNTIIELTF